MCAHVIAFLFTLLASIGTPHAFAQYPYGVASIVMTGAEHATKKLLYLYMRLGFLGTLIIEVT